MRFNLVCICFIVSCCTYTLYSFARQRARTLGLTKNIVIPFTLTAHNNIVVQALLNETDTIRLMFSTASDGVYLIKDFTGKLKSLRLNSLQDTVRSWGNSVHLSRSSENNALRIGDNVWKNLSITEDINSSFETDGKFGMALFTGKVVEIDFERLLIIVSTKLPLKVKQYKKLKLFNLDGLSLVEATCKTARSVSSRLFLLHSGYEGGLLLSDSCEPEPCLKDELPIFGEQILENAYGEKIRSTQSVMPTFFLGGYVLKNVQIGFFEGLLNNSRINVAGCDIIKRFNLIIDAERQNIFVRPSHLKPSK